MFMFMHAPFVFANNMAIRALDIPYESRGHIPSSFFCLHSDDTGSHKNGIFQEKIINRTRIKKLIIISFVLYFFLTVIKKQS